MIIRTSN